MARARESAGAALELITILTKLVKRIHGQIDDIRQFGKLHRHSLNLPPKLYEKVD